MRMDGPGAETLPRSVLHKERTPGAGWTRIHPGSIDRSPKAEVTGVLTAGTRGSLGLPCRWQGLERDSDSPKVTVGSGHAPNLGLAGGWPGGRVVLRVVLWAPSFPSQKNKPGLLSRGKRSGLAVASGPAGAGPARGGVGPPAAPEAGGPPCSIRGALPLRSPHGQPSAQSPVPSLPPASPGATHRSARRP